MKLYNIILIGCASIIFQLTQFHTIQDFICLICSILLLILIIYINKKNLMELYNNFYNKFYILSFLILINNSLIYISLPKLFLIIIKIIISILLLFDAIYLINYKFNKS